MEAMVGAPSGLLGGNAQAMGLNRFAPSFCHHDARRGAHTSEARSEALDCADGHEMRLDQARKYLVARKYYHGTLIPVVRQILGRATVCPSRKPNLNLIIFVNCVIAPPLRRNEFQLGSGGL